MKLLVHAHTTFSHDGRLSPVELAGLAARRGFDGVLLSDHYEDLDEHAYGDLVEECRSIETCRLIPGYEKDWGGFHICAFGVGHWMDDDDLEDWSARLREAGAILCLAHPTRYRQEVPTDVLSACDAVEIWNSKRPYDGVIGPHPETFRLLGPRLAFVGQDFHRLRDATNLGIEVDVRDDAGTDEIFAAIRRREYRSTSRLFTSLGPPSPLWRALLRVLHPVRRWMWVPPVKTVRAVRRLGIPGLLRS